MRNRSTNMPSNQVNKPPSNTTLVNRSGNVSKKPQSTLTAIVKLPKVGANTIGNTSVSNNSMKAIWEGGGIKRGNEGVMGV